ncbi:MAG: protein BatD [Chitinophagaceae bacterium]|nr:protein BatD [Chitinophagaceae bacterium]
MKECIFIVLLFCCSLQLHAQTKFYTLVSERTIGYKRTFQVQYIVEGAKKIKDFRSSKFADFNIEDEFEIPTTPTISAQTLQLVDAYSKIIVLSPKKTGVLTVPGATAKIDGKLMRSNTVKVVVRQTGLSPLSNADAEKEKVEDESEIKPGENIEQKIRENFYLKGEANKKTCYVGEPVMVVYKAYSRLNANSQVVRRPSLTGFSVVEMVDSYDNRPEIEKINGKSFFTHLIRKAQLFPLQAGTFTLDAAEVESTIYFFKNPDAGINDDLQRLLERSTVDQPPAFTRLEHKTVLKSAPFSISVKPLPEAGQPANFGGAVGQYSVALRLLKTELQQGEPGKLQVMISGNGNFPLVTAPSIEWPAGLDITDPSAKEELNKFIYPLRGGKIFEYNFSSKDTGSFSIPPVEFSYFDPALKKYVTKKSSAAIFHIHKGVKIGPSPARQATSVNFDAPLPFYWYWFGILAMGLTGYIIYFLWSRSKSRQKLQPVIPKTEPPKKSENIFEDPFNMARHAMYGEDKQKFYSEIQRVLWKTVAEKCHAVPSTLNKQNIAAQLRNCEISEDTISELQYILNECEWAVYTPSVDEKDMSKILFSSQKIRKQLGE